MPVRSANAEWDGSLLKGSGHMHMASGAWDGPYSFGSRFEEAAGTNPEELIAAAHAGCFSMALSAVLGDNGFNAERVQTTAKVKVEKDGDGFTITGITLDSRASVPGIDEAKFQELAELTKQVCPVSRLLTGAPITLNAKLESSAAG